MKEWQKEHARMLLELARGNTAQAEKHAQQVRNIWGMPCSI